MRLPASTWNAAAGSCTVTVTGLPSAGSDGSRIGATALPARGRTPDPLTLARDAKSTGPSLDVPPAAAPLPREDPWTVIREVPVIPASSPSGAEVNLATWPGRPPPKAASAVAAVPDNPGNEEMAA